MESSKVPSQDMQIVVNQSVTVGQLGSLSNLGGLNDRGTIFPMLREALVSPSVLPGGKQENQHLSQPTRNDNAMKIMSSKGPASSALKDILAIKKVSPGTTVRPKITPYVAGKTVLQAGPVLVPMLIRNPQVINPQPISNSEVFPSILVHRKPKSLPGQSIIDYSRLSTIINENLQQSSCGTDNEIHLYTEDGIDNNNAYKENRADCCELCSETDHNYFKCCALKSKCATTEHNPEGLLRNISISVQNNENVKEGEDQTKSNLVSNHENDVVGEFSTTLKTVDGGEQVMVINPMLENIEETGDDSQDISRCPISTHSSKSLDTGFEIENKYLLNNQIVEENNPTHSKSENTNLSCEWKIDSVYSLAPQCDSDSDSISQDSTDTASTEDVVISDELQEEELEQTKMETFSLNDSEWKNNIKPCFVVLERLATSKQNVQEANNRISQCSLYCRLRTLKLLCDLNLLDCDLKDHEGGNLSDKVEPSSPIISGGNMYDLVKKPDLKRKSTTSSPYALPPGDEQKSSQKTPSLNKGKSGDKDEFIQALQQLKTQVSEKREENKTRKFGEKRMSTEKVVVKTIVKHSPHATTIIIRGKGRKVFANKKDVNKDDQCHHSADMPHANPGQYTVSKSHNVPCSLHSLQNTNTNMNALTKNQSVSRKKRKQLCAEESTAEGNCAPTSIAQSPVNQSPAYVVKSYGNFNPVFPKMTTIMSPIKGNQSSVSSSSHQVSLPGNLPNKMFSAQQSGAKSSTVSLSTANPVSANKCHAGLKSFPKQITITTPSAMTSQPPAVSSKSHLTCALNGQIPHKTFSVQQSGAKRFLVPSTTAKPISPHKFGAALESLSKQIKQSPDKVNKGDNNYFLMNIDGQHLLIKTGPFPINSNQSPSSIQTYDNFRFVSKAANTNVPSSLSSSTTQSAHFHINRDPSSALQNSMVNQRFDCRVSTSTPQSNVTLSSLTAPITQSTNVNSNEYSSSKGQRSSMTERLPDSVTSTNNVTEMGRKVTTPCVSNLTMSNSYLDPYHHTAQTPKDLNKRVATDCKESSSKSLLKRPHSPSSVIEELKRRKRQKLEAKYPLPAGVIIKSEPITSGYDLDNNWSVTTEIDMGFVQEGDLDRDAVTPPQHPGTSEVVEVEEADQDSNSLPHGVSTLEAALNESDELPPLLERVSPTKAPINHFPEVDKAPPVLHQIQSSRPPLPALPSSQSFLPSLQLPPPQLSQPLLPSASSSSTRSLLPSSSSSQSVLPILLSSPPLSSLSMPLSQSLPRHPPPPPLSSSSSTEYVIELDVDDSTPSTLVQTSPSLPQLFSPPKISSTPFSSPPPLSSPFKTNNTHNSPSPKLKRQKKKGVRTNQSLSPLNNNCESGYNSLAASSSSETLASSSACSLRLGDGGNKTDNTLGGVTAVSNISDNTLGAVSNEIDNIVCAVSNRSDNTIDHVSNISDNTLGAVNNSNRSDNTFSAAKSKIERLKELLRKKEQHVDNLLKIQSQVPQVDLDSL